MSPKISVHLSEPFAGSLAVAPAYPGAASLQVSPQPAGTPLQGWRLIIRVFLPFTVAFYLSYLFRTINALISGALSSELALDAADLGLLTSVYFLTFAAVQLPVGIWLDRYGPRRVQAVLLLFAAAGAALFTVSKGFAPLVLGRALIGLGVAAALTGGLKAIVLWFPQDRVATMNGYMVMLGALGGVERDLSGRAVARLERRLARTVRDPRCRNGRVRYGQTEMIFLIAFLGRRHGGNDIVEPFGGQPR